MCVCVWVRVCGCVCECVCVCARARACVRQTDASHLLHYVHFVPLPHLVFPSALRLCHRAPVYLCAGSAHAEYTNNPAMYRCGLAPVVPV